MKATGQCLCGAVKVEAEMPNQQVGACHCSMCRKWSGGPMMAVDVEDALTITGEDAVTRYESSDWAERAFCSRCGTHLFYWLKPANHYILPAGLLDAESALAFDHQIFIEEKPAYYDFANATKNMTGAEVFAQFSGDA